MAWAFVQDAYRADLGGGSVASVQQAFSSNVTTGNHIYVAMRHGSIDSDITPTVTDNQGNTYTLIGKSFNSGESAWVGHWHAQNVTGGAVTVTVSFSPNVDDFTYLYIRESSGIATSDALDDHSERIAFISDTGTDATTGTAITTTVANDMVLGTLFSGTVTQTTGTGWTQRRDEDRLHAQDKNQTTAGSVTATWTIGSSTLCHIVTAAFKEAGGGDASAAASSEGTGTATATGASTATSVASSDGTSTAVMAGSSTASAAMSADGSSTATMVGAARSESVMLGEGEATATAVGEALADGSGAAYAAGESTAIAEGAATSAAEFSAEGVGTATAVGDGGEAEEVEAPVQPGEGGPGGNARQDHAQKKKRRLKREDEEIIALIKQMAPQIFQYRRTLH